MLALKTWPSEFARNRRNMPTSRAILDLPLEILAQIVEALFYSNARQGRIYFILAISRSCRAFRQASLPLLFHHISCVIADPQNHQERSRTALNNLVAHPTLLRHVRVVSVRRPLNNVSGSSRSPAAPEEIGSERLISEPEMLNDLKQFDQAVRYMTGLQQIRQVLPSPLLNYQLLMTENYLH